MKKKALILALMGVLACTVGVTALAFSAAKQSDTFPVKADPTGYSITFDESNTTVEAVGNKYAIYRTTPRGAKVGVVGSNDYKDDETSFTFNGASFWHLYFFDDGGALGKVGAYQFSTITGFAISFEEGGLVAFESFKTNVEVIASGTPHTEPSFTPDDHPMFYAGNSVTISSLTIWYSC